MSGTGVNIIPKKADFLDPKIIFCPQFLKKMPPVKIFFSNSTNTFAPIAPNLKKMPPIFKINAPN